EVAVGVARDLTTSAFVAPADAVRTAAKALDVALNKPSPDVVGVLLVDGMGGREETVAASINAVAPHLEIAGGSAADDGRLQTTHVFADGEAITDAAVVLLMRLGVPFSILKTEHLVPTAEKFVVTSVDSTGRLVHELNGRPARKEYARALGVDASTSGLV